MEFTNKKNYLTKKNKTIITTKQYNWVNRWDKPSRLFSYIPPLNTNDNTSYINNERKLKINDRSTRYFY